VEFNETWDPELHGISANELSGLAQGFSGHPEDLDEQIKLHEAMIKELPKQAEFFSRRLDLLSALASLYQEKQAYDQSIRRLKQGVAIAKQLNNIVYLAAFWGNLGSTYQDLGQPNKAIRAYWKAIRFDPEDAGLWIGLGQTYLIQGRVDTARSIFKKATMGSPWDENA
jgi:tetratricopeptide (TPR) repeat protein